MEKTLKILLVFALIVLVHSSPLPQEDGVSETTTTSTTTELPTPLRPTPPRRPLIEAVAQSIQNVNSIFSTVSSLVGSFTNSGYNAASGLASATGQFIGNTAQSMSNGINSMASSLSATINRPFQQLTSSSMKTEQLPIDPIPADNDVYIYEFE